MCTKSWGVLYSFDIDGMLFEFFMNFLNIEKNKIIFFFQYFKFSSRFMLIKKKNWCKKNIEKCPFTYWLNERWFLQIVERDSWIYIHYILYSLVLILYLKCGGGLGGGGGV